MATTKAKAKTTPKAKPAVKAKAKPASLSAIRRLVLQQNAARAALEKTTKDKVTTAAAAMSDADWRTHGAVTKFATGAARQVLAAQKLAAATSNSHQSTLLTRMSGRTVSPVKPVKVDRLRGVPTDTPYGRLADHYRWLTSEGIEVAEASRLTVERAATVADTDVMLAFRAQARENIRASKVVVGYRRVIHPEDPASKSGASCGLCIVASTVLYKPADLMPIHANCRCSVMPVVRDEPDAADEINKDDIKQVYAAAGGTTLGKKLKETRFTVQQHGELGPVLTYEGNSFRGPEEVAGTARRIGLDKATATNPPAG